MNDVIDPRCDAVVWRRDTYRRTGRTKSGFELHYQRSRCKRRAVDGELCGQHSKMVAEGWNLSRFTSPPR